MKLFTLLQYEVLLVAKIGFALATVIWQHPLSNSETRDYEHRLGTLRSWPTSADLCERSEGTAGYVDLDSGQRHIFFWSFESRNDPANDPVILWLTGGPGGSGVSVGLFGELGPCLIKNEDGRTLYNPYSWNSNATILFIDQPVGVGFSYRDGTGQPSNLIDATTDMYEFLQVYYDAYPEIANLDFYIAGESYGGTWVPSLAARIQKQQSPSRSRAHASQLESTATSIPLKGIMLGNALLTLHVQKKGIYETACMGEKPLFNESACAVVAKMIPYCERLLNVCVDADYDKFLCDSITERCDKQTNAFFADLGRSPYNFDEPCDGGLCFPENDYILNYLNSTRLRTALRIPDKVNYNTVSYEVYEDYERQGLVWRPSDHFVTYLLDEGIRVLVYVGSKDWYCNAPGMRYMVDSLTWHGLAPFRARTYKTYKMGGRPIGYHKTWEELSFVEIDEAGHMSPRDKPEEVLHIVQKWTKGKI